MNVMPAIKIEKEAITSKDTRGGCMRKNKTRSKINAQAAKRDLQTTKIFRGT